MFCSLFKFFANLSNRRLFRFKKLSSFFNVLEGEVIFIETVDAIDEIKFYVNIIAIPVPKVPQASETVPRVGPIIGKLVIQTTTKVSPYHLRDKPIIKVETKFNNLNNFYNLINIYCIFQFYHCSYDT